MNFAGRLLRFVVRRYRASGRPAVPPPERDSWLAVPFAWTVPVRPSLRIGAMVHLFHPELAAEFADILRHLGPDAQIMITTDTAAKKSRIEAAFADWPAGSTEVRLVENRGRDIAPKLCAFTDRYGQFDVILFLHSKKTDFSPAGRGWRELLLDGLCGSAETVGSILQIFAASPRTGLVFCQHHEPIRPYTGWEANYARARDLARRMGLRLRRRCEMEYPTGSMFWARPQALQPLLALGLKPADFPAEAGQTDGTLAHAIERLVALAAELAGFTWCKVGAPAHYRNSGTPVTLPGERDLQDHLDKLPSERLLHAMARY